MVVPPVLLPMPNIFLAVFFFLAGSVLKIHPYFSFFLFVMLNVFFVFVLYVFFFSFGFVFVASY